MIQRLFFLLTSHLTHESLTTWYGRFYRFEREIEEIEMHTCTPESCPQGENYFVTAVDGSRWYYMAGPYPTHQQALDKVNEALKIANKNDGRAWFMSWGTVKSYRTEMGSITKAGLCAD
jgi:hypothetical protein